jgi:hypothetical protein
VLLLLFLLRLGLLGALTPALLLFVEVPVAADAAEETTPASAPTMAAMVH